MGMKRLLLLLGAASALGAGPAAAQEAPGLLGGIQIGKNADAFELRLGGGAYDAGPFTPDSFSGGVINSEFLVPSFDFLSAIGSPRPYLGAEIAISDDPIHFVYGGLNWEAYLTKRFSIGFSAGGSINSDSERVSDDGDERDLGSRVLFHLQVSAGFDLTPKLGVQAFINHFSNANLGSSNDGMESTGARLTYRF
jgi:lipid A 3-O-deacylase